MRFCKSCIVLVGILIPFFSIASERIIIENFTRKNGLFHSDITDISKDYLGYLWITAGQGVQRYDGYYFETFKESKDGLANEFVNSVYTDTNGKVMWFGAYDGNISRYDIIKNEFRNYKLPKYKEYFTQSQSEVRQIQRLNDSILIVYSMPNNIIFLNEKTGDVKQSKCFNGMDQWFTINMFILSKNKDFYFATNTGIFKGEYINEDIEIKGSTSGKIKDKIFHFLKIDENGNLYSLAGKGLFILNTNLDAVDYYKIYSGIKNLKLTCIEFENENVAWIGSSRGGLFKLNMVDRSVLNLKSNNEFNSLIHNSISKLFYDDGYLWVGTSAGISKIDLHSHRFKTNKLEDYLNSNGFHLWMIHKDYNDCIWLTVNDSLIFEKSEKNEHNLLYKKIEKYFNGIIPYAVVEDSENFWVGSSKGLIKINKASYKISNFNPQVVITGSNDKILLRKLLLDKDYIWLVYNFGLAKFNKINTTFDWFLFPDKLLSTNHGSVATSIIKDSLNNVWFGLNHIGLCKFNTISNSFFLHYKDESNKTGIPVRNVLDIHMDSRNNDLFWIGTFGYGIYKYNVVTNKFKAFTKKHGLENDRVYLIKESSDTILWLSTDFGISKFNIKREFFSNYSYSDGIDVEEFNMGAGYKEVDGNIYFGGVNGYVMFDPLTFEKPLESKVKVVLEKILIGDKVFKLFPLPNNDEEFRIPGVGKNISFNISVINYNKSDKIDQYVILKGYDNKWQKQNAPPYIYNYKNLLEGDYEFIVKTNNRESFNYPTINVKFRIVAPWYKSLVIKIFIVFFVLGLIGLFVWVRMRYLNAQRKYLKSLVAEQTEEIRSVNEQLEETNMEVVKQNVELEQHRNNLENIVRQRTQELNIAKEKAVESDKLKSSFLANLSHEIRTPMNSIVGFSKLMETEVKHNNAENALEYVELVHSNSNSLLKLINDIIELSLIESGDIVINSEAFDANELIAEVYYENIDRKTSELDFLMNLSTESINVNSDRIRIKQILNNFVNNSFKFTKEGVVEIGYDIEIDSLGSANQINFWIKDSGIGIKKDDVPYIFELFRKIEDKRVLFRGTGVGLRVCSKLTEKLNGIIHVKSVYGTGSTFYLKLPMEFQRNNS
jgi:signal transduction histidine kinase